MTYTFNNELERIIFLLRILVCADTRTVKILPDEETQ